MANTTITPNMKLPVPVPGTDPGPDWAQNIVADMYAIDSHNHSSGQGVAITPDGLNINADLPLNGNDLTLVNAVTFNQSAAATDTLDSLSDASGDLYFTDGAGNKVRITQSGSVAGSTGTITGLPSGTASASFSAGTFTFQAATSTPATMNVGPLVVGAAIASSKNVTIAPATSLAANYALTLPSGLPLSTSFFNVDTSGNMGTVAATGSGSVVLATSPTIASPTITGTITSPTIATPTFSGNPSGTITASTYSPTLAFSSGSGTAAAASFSYTRIGNRVTVDGQVTVTPTSGGVSVYTCTVPIAPSGNFAHSYDVVGGAFVDNGSSAGTVSENFISATVGAKTAAVSVRRSGGSTLSDHNIHFTYSCA